MRAVTHHDQRLVILVIHQPASIVFRDYWQPSRGCGRNDSTPANSPH